VEEGNAAAATATTVRFAAQAEMTSVVAAAAAVVWEALLVSQRHPFPKNLSSQVELLPRVAVAVAVAFAFGVAAVDHVVASAVDLVAAVDVDHVVASAVDPVVASAVDLVAAAAGLAAASFAAEAATDPVVACAAAAEAAIATTVAVVACRAYPIPRLYLPVVKEALVAAVAVGDNLAAAAAAVEEDNFPDEKDGSIRTAGIAAGIRDLSPPHPVTRTRPLHPPQRRRPLPIRLPQPVVPPAIHLLPLVASIPPFAAAAAARQNSQTSQPSLPYPLLSVRLPPPAAAAAYHHRPSNPSPFAFRRRHRRPHRHPRERESGDEWVASTS